MATDFQRAIWEVVSNIPEGEVMSYSEVAKRAGFPGADRSVAAALEALPWWRVVRQNRLILDTDSRGDYQAKKLFEEGWTLDRTLRRKR